MQISFEKAQRLFSARERCSVIFWIHCFIFLNSWQSKSVFACTSQNLSIWTFRKLYKWCTRKLTESSSFISQLRLNANRTCIQSSQNTQQRQRRRRKRCVTLCYGLRYTFTELRCDWKDDRCLLEHPSFKLWSNRVMSQLRSLTHMFIFAISNEKAKKKTRADSLHERRTTLISGDRGRKRHCFTM